MVGEGLYITVDLHGEAASVGRVPGCSGPAEQMSHFYPVIPLESHCPKIPIDTVSAQTPVTPAILSSMFLLHPGPRNSLELRQASGWLELLFRSPRPSAVAGPL